MVRVPSAIWVHWNGYGRAVVGRHRAQPGGLVEVGDGPGPSMHDLRQRQLEDVAGAGVLQGRDQRVDRALLHHRLHREAARRPATTRVGDFIDGSRASTASQSASATLSFTSTLPRASRAPSSSVRSWPMAWRLAGSAALAGLAISSV